MEGERYQLRISLTRYKCSNRMTNNIAGSALKYLMIIAVGKCECGKCTCYPPGDSRVYGKTCECDNRRCEDLDGVVCGGHGTCSCGRCVCERGWFGKLCQHPRKCNMTEEQSRSLCESADGIQCSGKGEYLRELGQDPCPDTWFAQQHVHPSIPDCTLPNGNHSVLCSNQT
ncbi:hypothetical protein CB1_060782074 [Camelus ferus]|nr:hypothetical protein CB1_060782074 [Camelus ferus]